MLALALLVVVAAYVLASLGRTSTMPADIGPFLGVVVGLMVSRPPRHPPPRPRGRSRPVSRSPRSSTAWAT